MKRKAGITVGRGKWKGEDIEKQYGEGGEIYTTLTMFPQQRKECTTGR